MTTLLATLQDEASRLTALLLNGGVGHAGLMNLLAAIVAAQPDHQAARLALCTHQWEAGARADAIAQYRVLANQNSACPDMRQALGFALLQTEAWEEGIAQIDAAGAGLPRESGLLDLYINGLVALGRDADAAAACRHAVALDPSAPSAHFNLGWRLLATGAWNEGWPEFAWRWPLAETLGAWRCPENPLEVPDPAQWRGRTVLLFAEQGHGDTIQCLRYLPLARATGGRIILEVQAGLERLVRWMANGIEVVPVGAPVPAFDIAVPMLHLPWAFGTMPDSVPGRRPYLAPHPAAVAHWQQRLEGLGNMRVGLIWAGNSYRGIPAAHALDRLRSTSLAAMAPLASVEGIDFVSLQVGDEASQADQPPMGMRLHNWTSELHDFADTAALMMALDLVISVDTASLHLAGALGRPVWLLNRHDGCWRWLRGREDSPWYPSLRQFTQTRPGDWAGVMARVAAALADRVRRT